MRASTGRAIAADPAAAIVNKITARPMARAATFPSAPVVVIDPTLVTRSAVTSGIAVIGMRLMKIVPAAALQATTAVAPTEDRPASARPSANPATRPISTRVVRDTRGY